ncbi:POLR2J [Symbiodinium sp. CCMP2592]|nr:POLR2J [Symbiodinium sp. CCMP2592]
MATPGQLQMYNKLEVGEMFGLDHRAKGVDGVIRRIHVLPDEKVSHAVLFQIWLEDHTLGNILRMELLRNEAVLFAGYKVPHPLNNMIELRVQTTPSSTPELALRRAVANLRSECKSMLSQFDEGIHDLGADNLLEIDDEKLEKSPKGGYAGVQDTDLGYSPSDEDNLNNRFQEQLEAFEQRHAGAFSPEYLPTSLPPEDDE